MRNQSTGRKQCNSNHIEITENKLVPEWKLAQIAANIQAHAFRIRMQESRNVAIHIRKQTIQPKHRKDNKLNRDIDTPNKQPMNENYIRIDYH